MRKFFGILLALVVLSTGAQSQQVVQPEPRPTAVVRTQPQVDRYDWIKQNCPYRASELRPANERYDRQGLNELSEAKWQRIRTTCPQYEANLPGLPKVPPGTYVAQRPKGNPLEIDKRPAGAPKGVYYRCDRETKLPNPNGKGVCGPP